MERGTPYVIGDRSTPPSLEGFFGRATRTLANNIESALMWVPPVVVILELDVAFGRRNIYRGARRLWVFLLAQDPAHSVAGLVCRDDLLRPPPLCWPSFPSPRSIKTPGQRPLSPGRLGGLGYLADA